MDEERNERKDSWDIFLDNIRRICAKKLELEKYLFPKENKDKILKLLNDVLNELQTDEVKNIINKEKRRLSEEKKGDKIVSWLETEIELFNSSVSDDFSGPFKDPKHANNRISQGKTIKDSIDRLFKIPGWLKKILDVLNELLGLIRGAP